MSEADKSAMAYALELDSEVRRVYKFIIGQAERSLGARNTSEDKALLAVNSITVLFIEGLTTLITKGTSAVAQDVLERRALR